MTEKTKGLIQSFLYVEKLSRRSFLKIAGTVTGTAVGMMVIPSVFAIAAVPDGIKVMSASEYDVFHRLMEVMFPVKDSNLVPLEQIPVIQTLDAALLGPMPPHILAGLKGGVDYFNNGPVAMFGKKFSELTNDEAEKFCDSWANSNEVPQRALAMGLKKLIGLAYWANPPTWAPLGYDGPVSKRWGLKSYGNAPMPKH